MRVKLYHQILILLVVDRVNSVPVLGELVPRRHFELLVASEIHTTLDTSVLGHIFLQHVARGPDLCWILQLESRLQIYLSVEFHS